MKRLLRYHTTSANPDYYWENNAVAQMLIAGSINTFQDYQAACKKHGCTCYNEEVFNDWLSSKEVTS